MPECPNGKYLEEIVTASGLTPSAPLKVGVIDWSGSEFDFAEWDARAVELIARLEASWRKLKAMSAVESMPAPQYNELVGVLNDVRDRYSRIRKPWTSQSSAVGSFGWTWGITHGDLAFDATAEISQIIAVINDAQCLRQRIDVLIAAYGGSPDLPSGVHAKPSTTLMEKVGMATIAGCVAYGIYRIAQKRRSSQ